jgi:hypothetical protein
MYRGIVVGRRARLSQVGPAAGFVEVPHPMPVGTQLEVAAGDVSFRAIVAQVREQVSGSGAPSGMVVAPDLADPAAAAWWSVHVTDSAGAPELQRGASEPRAARAVGRAHSIGAVQDAPALAAEPAPPAAPDAALGQAHGDVLAAGSLAGSRAAEGDEATTVTQPMPPIAEPEEPAMALDLRPTLEMAPLSADDLQDARGPAGASVESVLIDDGRRTIIMDSIDLSALGLDAPAPAAAGEARELAAQPGPARGSNGGADPA